jgi:hypothetical protein
VKGGKLMDMVDEPRGMAYSVLCRAKVVSQALPSLRDSVLFPTLPSAEALG